VVTTQLRRKGMVLEMALPMPVGGKATAQEIGSAITYGRRYGLAAMMGVCTEDDDGNAASKPRSKGKAQVQEQHDPDGEQDPDPSWYRLQALTNRIAQARRLSEADAQAAICTEADVWPKGHPSDDEVESLIMAAERLLAPPRKPLTPGPDRDHAAVRGEQEVPKARGKGKPAAKPPAEQTEPVDPPDLREARASFQSAYRHYQAECKEQGVEPKPWLDLATEAIGEPWNTKQGSHPAEHYILAADMCEQAIERLRTGGKAA
jgi:hypothetical protein